MQDTGMGQVAGLRTMFSANCPRLLGEVVGIFEVCHLSNIQMGSVGILLGPPSERQVETGGQRAAGIQSSSGGGSPLDLTTRFL